MKGRPVLGVIGGFFFGLFLAADLHMLKIWPLSKTSQIALPIAGVVLGLVLASTTPFGKRTAVVAPATNDALTGPDDLAG